MLPRKAHKDESNGGTKGREVHEFAANKLHPTIAAKLLIGADEIL